MVKTIKEQLEDVLKTIDAADRKVDKTFHYGDVMNVLGASKQVESNHIAQTVLDHPIPAKYIDKDQQDWYAKQDTKNENGWTSKIEHRVQAYLNKHSSKTDKREDVFTLASDEAIEKAIVKASHGKEFSYKDITDEFLEEIIKPIPHKGHKPHAAKNGQGHQ